MRRMTRRTAIISGALSLGAIALGSVGPTTAQLEGAPTLVMFHVEAGW